MTIKKKKLKLYHMNSKDLSNYCLLGKKVQKYIFYDLISVAEWPTLSCPIVHTCICIHIWETWVFLFWNIGRVYHVPHNLLRAGQRHTEQKSRCFLGVNIQEREWQQNKKYRGFRVRQKLDDKGPCK